MSEAVDGARRSAWSTVTRWLIVVNIAVFAIDLVLYLTGNVSILRQHNGAPITRQLEDGRITTIGYPVLASYGYFSVDLAIVGKQVWRFFSYQFVHANIEHIVVNLLGLMLAGQLVEERLGRARYLVFYLLCGAMGPIAHMVLALLGVLSMNYFTPLVGASASIYGILVAAARIAPNEIVEIIFPPIDLKLRTLVLIMIGLSAAAVIWNFSNAGGHAAHLGGAVMGWFLARRMIPRASLPEA